MMHQNTDLIPRDFLFEGSRLPRLPLQEWADEILETIRGVRTRGHEQYGEFSTCMNQAALIETYRGRLESAHSLCMAQISWLVSLGERLDRKELVEWSLQPWINTGRLLRLQGRVDEALTRFSLLPAFEVQSTVQVGDCCISGDDWRLFGQTESMETFLEAVYVVDSLKTLIGVNAHERAIDFIRAEKPIRSRAIGYVLDEAQVLCLARREQWHLALDIATMDHSVAPPVFPRNFRLLEAILRAASGEIAQPRSIALELALLTVANDAAVAYRPSDLRFLLYLGKLNEFLDSTDIALAVYKKGLDTAYSVRDQPSQIEFVKELLRIPRQQVTCENDLTRNLDSCDYVHILRREKYPQKDRVARDDVFDALLCAISAVISR